MPKKPEPSLLSRGATGLGKAALGATLTQGAGVFDFIGRAAAYTGNHVAPNLQPGIEAAVDLYYKGLLTEAETRSILHANAVDWDPNFQGNGNKKHWKKLVESHDFVFPVEDAYDLYLRRKITEDRFRAILKWHGIWRAADQQLIIGRSDLIEPDSALALYRQGELNWAEVVTRFRAAGMTDEAEIRKLAELSTPIGFGDALLLYFQGRLTPAQLTETAERNGIISAEDVRRARMVLEQVPGGADLVRFAVREVWDANVVQRFGYDEGFDQIPEFVWWMKAQGFGGNPNPRNATDNPYQLPPKPPTFQGTDQQWAQLNQVDSWARAFYRAHWDLPSPTQGYEFLHRLRPNRIERYRQLIPGVQPWTIDDLRLLLKTADYPAPFRDRLAAVSYHVITRVDLRRMYSTGVIDLAEVYEQNLDYGYNPTDARNLTTFIERDERNKRLAPLRKKERARAERAFRAGWIDQTELRRKLRLTGLTDEEAYNLARSIGLDDSEADDVLAVETVRKLYRVWEIDEIGARQRLSRLGIGEEGILRLLYRWGLEREQRSRRVTASQIARWVVRGVLGPTAAVKRLGAMGYDHSDAMRIIHVARQDHDILVARAAKATAQTQLQHRRAAEAEVRATQRQAMQAARRLARGGTPGNLVKWLKKGLITRQDALNRLVALGWSLADADTHLTASVPPITNQQNMQGQEMNGP